MLRGAYALHGPRFEFQRQALDVLIEGERIAALVGCSMLDRAMIDNFRFADLVPPALAARMRTMPRPAPGDYLRFRRGFRRRADQAYVG